MTPEQYETVRRLAALGYTDWEIHDATGHARSTIQVVRQRAGIPPTTHRSGRRPRRQIPRDLLAPRLAEDDPAIAAYRAEKARRAQSLSPLTPKREQAA